MKRVLILLFIVLAAGAFLGEKMVQDPGYVLISYQNTTLETSIWVLVLLSFFAFLVAHWALNLFFGLGLSGRSLGLWNRKRSSRTAQKRTFKGLVALSEGNWWQAQRLLSQAAPQAAQPLINYLGAAKAAHEQGNIESTDTFFAKAREIAPEAEVSIGLQEADVFIDRGNSKQAFVILKRLHSLAPKHTSVLRELAELYEDQKDWDGLITLLPKLRKNKVLSAEQLAAIEAQCYAQMLTSVVEKLPIESSEDSRLKALTKGWKALPGNLNQTPQMIATYARALLAAGSPDNAEKFLRNHVKRNWDNELIELYGTIKAAEPVRQYNLVLSWLKKQPQHAELLLCAARLAMFSEKWTEAIAHFEANIKLQPNVVAYRGLARLLESQGQHEKALEMSQMALELTEDNSPEISLPGPVKIAKNEAANETDNISAQRQAHKTANS
jgi:HemY protein